MKQGWMADTARQSAAFPQHFYMSSTENEVQMGGDLRAELILLWKKKYIAAVK